MNWRQKLVKIRAQRHVSQADLAKQIGVGQAQVWQWEAGRNPRSEPKLSQAAALARELQVSLDYLVNDALDEPPMPGVTEAEHRLLLTLRDIHVPPEEALRRIFAAGPQSTGSVPETTRESDNLTAQLEIRETQSPSKPRRKSG